MPIVTYTDVPCSSCGVTFGVPARFDECRREDRKTFYCPNGHQLSYTTSLLEKAQRERDEARRAAERAERRAADERADRLREERSHAATKGRLTKLKNSVDAGDCPCCGRHFPALAEHMKVQHPEWAPGEADPIKRLGAGEPAGAQSDDVPPQWRSSSMHPDRAAAYQQGRDAPAHAENPFAAHGRYAYRHRAWAAGRAAAQEAARV